MGACCGSCVKGGACEGGGSCESKASAGLSPADLPHLREAMRGTGSRPSWAPSAPSAPHAQAYAARVETPKSSGYREGVEPTDGGSDEEDPNAEPPRRATIEEFERKIRGLPVAEREAALREFMAEEGASEASTGRAVAALVGQGLEGLFGFLRSDTDRDIAAIRARALVDAEVARQRGQTDRAEILARYGNGTGNGTQPPAAGVSPVVWLALTAAAVGIAYGIWQGTRPAPSGSR